MNEDIDIQTIIYPPSPHTFPIVWRPTLYDMIPPRFAVWIPNKADYQVFDISRMPNHSIVVKPVRTDRENPFYFAIQNGGDRTSRTITIYKPRASKHTYADVGIWFTGAWLCKRTNGRLQATVPILGVSDASHFPVRGNIGIYHNSTFVEWTTNYTSDYIREMIHTRKVYTSLHMIDELVAPIISELPAFVATALVKSAIEKNDICPISMEPIELNNSAVTSCFHIFERNCIQNWLESHSNCPVCKQTCKITPL